MIFSLKLYYAFQPSINSETPAVHIVDLKASISCADPEIFMRGGPTKMVIFDHRRGGGGGSNAQKIPKLSFFR